MAWVSSLSPLARITIIDMPVLDSRAPALTATLVTTSALPRSTSTSVTAGLSDLRSAILLRCDWPLLLAISTRFCIGQPRRLRQHGAGDGNVVIGGQAADDMVRRIGDRRQIHAQFDPRAAFDVLDQAHDDIVEHRG